MAAGGGGRGYAQIMYCCDAHVGEVGLCGGAEGGFEAGEEPGLTAEEGCFDGGIGGGEFTCKRSVLVFGALVSAEIECRS